MDAFSVNISHAAPVKQPVRRFATGRMLRATQALDSNAASFVGREQPNSGASQNKSKYAGAAEPKNFIEHMLTVNKENKDAFDKMLNNQFCIDMAAANTEAEIAKVLKGYKWYMIQDFKYCQGLMQFYVKRTAKATDTAEVLRGGKHIVSSYDFAQSILASCVEDLKIPEADVLNAKEEQAATDYTKFEVDNAEKKAWATSMIVMIPCIQGYYLIAKNMVKTSKRDDTPWYDGWVLPNLDKKYPKDQVDFFEKYLPDWRTKKDDPKVQAEWDELFRAACGHEVSFFAIGENPPKDT